MALATAPTIEASPLSPAEARHLKALEGRIERGLSVFKEVGLALLEIRDKELFRLTHLTFESYCRDRWGMDRQRAYQLMGAAEVAQVLPEGKGPVNEAQARELVPLMNADPSLVAKAWEAVEARNEPVTAQVIREVVREVTSNGNGNGGATMAHATPVTATAKLVALLSKARGEVEVWKGTHPSRAEKKAVIAAVEDIVKALG